MRVGGVPARLFFVSAGSGVRAGACDVWASDAHVDVMVRLSRLQPCLARASFCRRHHGAPLSLAMTSNTRVAARDCVQCAHNIADDVQRAHNIAEYVQHAHYFAESVQRVWPLHVCPVGAPRPDAFDVLVCHPDACDVLACRSDALDVLACHSDALDALVSTSYSGVFFTRANRSIVALMRAIKNTPPQLMWANAAVGVLFSPWMARFRR